MQLPSEHGDAATLVSKKSLYTYFSHLIYKEAELNSKFKTVLKEIGKCLGPEPKPIKPLGRV